MFGAFVQGQANIYALFMAVSAKMLSADGQMIFITPRSYASGSYFKSFRDFFFRQVTISRIHLFGSRKDAFGRDNILQETMIMMATKRTIENCQFPVVISSSKGVGDILTPEIWRLPQNCVMDMDSMEKILYIPTNKNEQSIIDLFRSWTGSLNEYNIQVSTGPVVAYRATEHILMAMNDDRIVAPLIWLHHVFKMSIDWPSQKPGKGNYIRVCQGSRSLLLPNKNYVLLRRFSAKDDKSRLIASPYFAKMHNVDFIGVENRLNYIYRPNGELKLCEVMGLAGLLNSTLFDKYFRIFNGNVNVSATELRAMPFPPLSKIMEIGEQLMLCGPVISQKCVDDIVSRDLINITEPVLWEN
jgi:adenine-specific DNA-methyltransferase